jgi:hypothetical protein
MILDWFCLKKKIIVLMAKKKKNTVTHNRMQTIQILPVSHLKLTAAKALLLATPMVLQSQKSTSQLESSSGGMS